MPTASDWGDKRVFKVAFTDVEYTQTVGGRVVTVKPHKGTDIQQDKVKRAVQEWEAVCNVSFQFIDRVAEADFRVGFNALVNGKPDNGSWSYVGSHQPGGEVMTMHFGWVSSATGSDIRPFTRLYEHATIIHEFGHALGLAHEHQNPFGGVRWDEAKVLEEYSGPPNWWSPEAIRSNILDVIPPDELKSRVGSTVSQYTIFDRMSVMFYGAQARLQQAPAKEMRQPLVISKVDARFMAKQFGPSRVVRSGPKLHKQLGLDVYGDPVRGLAAPTPPAVSSSSTTTVTTVTKVGAGGTTVVTTTAVTEK